MYIESLDLKNFKLCKDVHIDFQKGLNIISGVNGQGKSHILKAVAFLLTNYTEKKLDKFINWGSDEFYAHMVFYIGEDKFDISARYAKKKGSSTERKLIINDKITIEGSTVLTALSSKVDPLLGQASMLSLQWSPNIITTQSAERRDFLKRIHNADFKAQIKEIEETIKATEKETLSKLEKEIYALTNKEYKFGEVRELPFDSVKYDLYSATANTLLMQISQIDSQIQERDKLLVEKTSLEHQKEVNVAKKNKLIVDKEAFLTTKENVLTKIKSKIDPSITLTEQFESTDFLSEVKAIDEELKSFVVERIGTFDETPLQELQVKLNELYSSITVINKSIEATKSGVCPTCNRPFESHDIEDYQKELDSLTALKESIVASLDEEKTKKKEFDEKLQNKKVVEVKHKAALEKKSRAEKQSEIDKDNFIKNIEKAKLAHENEVKGLHRQIELINQNLDSFDSSVVAIDEAIQNIESRLASIVIIDVDVDSKKILELEYKEIESKKAEYDSITTQNELILQLNEKLTKEKEQDAVLLDKSTKEREQVILKIEHLKKVKELLRKDFPNFIISSLLDGIRKNMNEWVEKVYDGRYPVYIEEDSTGISILYGSEKEEASFSSGFEHGLLSLAYMNAMNKSTKYGLLMLDEIDAYATDKNSDKIYRMIAESPDYEQILLISHKPDVKKMLEDEYQAKVFEVKNGVVFENT